MTVDGVDMTPSASVEITMTGPGGGITYREDEQTIAFDWEFALSPAIALIWGPKRDGWDARYPWAAGRQAQIYDFVGAEVVRQKALGAAYEYDLDLGDLTILNGNSVRGRELRAAAAVAATNELRRHLSVDARLTDIESGPLNEADLARELRRLSRPEDGLEHALRLAAAHPSETIKQALLWASYNATACAPSCAALLLTMTGGAQEPFDANTAAVLAKLGKHVSSFDRDAAFAELSRRVGMTLDQSSQD